ncbi:MAG: GTPase ObgE [Acidobacteriota bacterium]
MFVDRTIVTFIAGKGGDGCVSFHREKFISKGGPDGGDGGSGGSIILVSRINVNSLIDFKGNHTIKAENGKNGSGSNRYGRSGKNNILNVPPGTVIKSFPEEKIIFDFGKEDVEFVIAEGGKGGPGNVHFKSSVNQAPRVAKAGTPGESIKVILELKLIAFAGLVGFPNAGKSTLISKISRAKPKVANYPFTTLSPGLGIVYQGYESMAVADIPGIIEGAHKGEGMGIDFLRHIERNRVLIFLIDPDPSAEHSPKKSLEILINELKSYKKEIMRKKFLVAVNKIDLFEETDNQEKLKELKEYCSENKLDYIEISALKEINLNKLKNKLFTLLNEKA